MTLNARVASTLLIASVLACAHALGPSEVHAWDWFRAENGNIREGNERLRASDAAGALRSYELAARELPSDPGVHLNRGLALLALDQHDKAREAFLLATEPPASAQIRAAAYYDLGLAFYRQADAAATAAGADAVAQGGAIPGAIPGAPPGGAMPGAMPGAPAGPLGGAVAGSGAPAPQADHREAQRLFREAADGFRRSLRLVPGNRDAAWNLELALRRLREEEERQRQEDEQRRAEQEQQQQQQQQDQDQQAQNDPNQPPQDGQQGDPQQDQQPQDQQQQDGQDGDQQQQPGDQQQQDQPPQDPQQQQDQQAQNDANQQQPQPGEENGDEGGERDQGQDSPQGDGLPGDVARVLDALRDGEDNLERYRARARALRENRAPAQDW